MRVTAKVTRSGSWWAIEVPEVSGLFTQARHLREVAAMVQDAVALMEDVPAESVDVEVQVALGESGVDNQITSARQAARDARRAEAEATRAMRAVVSELRGRGLTVRDIGLMLDISPQRVSQIEAKGGTRTITHRRSGALATRSSTRRLERTQTKAR